MVDKTTKNGVKSKHRIVGNMKKVNLSYFYKFHLMR